MLIWRTNELRTLRQLARHADALIEDKPVGFLEQNGLGYAALHDLNPALV